ncbi:sulfite exporter TauE/SafE family protein [Campylobacter blaseri]|uniref:Probable membrane transporter protein n=1 Tax=Campylobacter blaseri TaxID=2042961 RepID=A0A2P8QZF2_9BACT|nr:sulfite exporter TauE/SafE family protein [Campylobacter blaseri]PSM51627.1 hypothetical protein CQ405_07480 [Campylobacter blaseri]PSM53420.1 hypothetical protein CRN67_07485 [Campylobacter blaseri]QKF86716.1 sulfite exporter TauE/SafE family protein [Campylobacter blaseri]
MEILHIIEFLGLGVVVGAISGFFGIGGGTVVVPTMLFLGYDIKTAVGISITQMLFSSIFGSYVNYKNNKLKINEGIFVGLGGLFGASLSGYIVSGVKEIYLEIGLAIALALTIIKFFKAPQIAEKEINSIYILFIVGFLIGVFAISMGIGGALFLTPILVGFLGFDIKKALSMGLFFVVFSSFSGFISLSFAGLVDYKNGFMLGIGSLLGVYYGVKFSHKIDKSLQKKLLLILYTMMLLMTLKKIFLG